MNKYITEEDLELLVSHHLNKWNNMKRKPNLLLKIIAYIYIGLAILVIPLVFIASLFAWIVIYPIWRYREKTKDRAKTSSSQSTTSSPPEEDV